MTWHRSALVHVGTAGVTLLLTFCLGGLAWAQMDLRLVSGVPRPVPASELPAGTVSVRVVRGAMTNNVVGADVQFEVNGKATSVKTGDDGRAQIAGVARGARVKAFTTVDGERVESQEFAIDDAGIRVVLVAALGGTSGPAAVQVPARPGSVAIGPGSRIVVDFADERLNIYYAVQVVNDTTAPVDIGGPLIVDLPTEARGAGLMDGSTPQAKVGGTRVTVTGPFAAGQTTVNVAFELPYSGPSVTLEQKWPVASRGIDVFALKSGEIDIASPQLTAKQASVQQGQALVTGLMPGLPAGQTLSLQISGLPHHARWPRYTALSSAAAIMGIGLWAAFGPPSRRRRA